MNDQTVSSVVVPVVGLVSTIFTGIMAYLMLRLKQKADAAAVEVKQVAKRLAITEKSRDAKLEENKDKLEALSVVADATHKLSNSKMGNALRINKNVTRRLAELSKDVADATLADEAELQYDEHQRQQSKVDAAFPEGIPPASSKGK